MTHVDQTPQRLLAETRHVARYLLAGNPREADMMLESNRLELPPDPPDGRVVFAWPPPESGYVVVDRGTRTTRTELPAWATPEHIVEVPPTTFGDTVWRRFEETAAALKQTDSPFYDEMEIEETVAAIRPFYTAGLSPDAAAMLSNSATLWPVRAEWVDALLAEPETARAWAQMGIEKTRNEFGALRLPLASAAAALATLTYLLNLEDPRVALAAGLLRTARMDVGADESIALSMRPDLARQAIADSPFAAANLGIMFDVGFYATHMQLVGAPGLHLAWSTGSTLAEIGATAIDRARRLTAIEPFYYGLAGALAHFAASREVCEYLTRLYGSSERASGDFPDLEARLVLCEERRVTVLGSLWHATGIHPHDLNPTEIPSLHVVTDGLATAARRTSDAWLHDMALRLVLPTFLRDLMLGMTHRKAGRAEAALPILERTFSALERDRDRNSQLPMEPNYLIPVARELEETHRILGNAHEAAAFRARVEAERTPS